MLSTHNQKLKDEEEKIDKIISFLRQAKVCLSNERTGRVYPEMRGYNHENAKILEQMASNELGELI